MHPKGASKNRDDHAIFSKDGPNLISPELTNNPSVIPKRYKLRNRNVLSIFFKSESKRDVNKYG